MMNGAGPLGHEVAGEQEEVSFWGGRFVLTDRRVLYRAKQRDRHSCHAVQVQDVTATGLEKRTRFDGRRLFLPLGVFCFGFFASWVLESEGPIILAFFLSLLTLPLAWASWGGYDLYVAAPGHRFAKRVPKRHLADAKSFLDAVEVARFALRAETQEDPVPVGPTTVPFGR
jgi:hypothetical protein